MKTTQLTKSTPAIATFSAGACFFVQNNNVERLTIPVARFAHSSEIDLLDRSSNNELVIDDCGIDWTNYCPVIPYGSVQFIRKVQESSLSRYVWHSDDNFSTEAWLNNFGSLLLNSSGQLVAAGDVVRHLGHAPFHVRPNHEDKTFNARVFDEKSWAATFQEKELLPTLSCWLSPVKGIQKEWRCWFVGGQPIEISQYAIDGKISVSHGGPQEVWDFAKKTGEQWLPAPCVVLDVALHDGDLYVLEFNLIHCSGWYASDTKKILSAWMKWSQNHFKNQNPA